MEKKEAKNLVRRLRRAAHAAYRECRRLESDLRDAQQTFAKAQNEVAMAEYDLDKLKAAEADLLARPD